MKHGAGARERGVWADGNPSVDLPIFQDFSAVVWFYMIFNIQIFSFKNLSDEHFHEFHKTIVYSSCTPFYFRHFRDMKDLIPWPDGLDFIIPETGFVTGFFKVN